MKAEFYTSNFGIGDLVETKQGKKGFVREMRRDISGEVEAKILVEPFLDGHLLTEIWTPETELNILKSKALRDGQRVSALFLNETLSNLEKEPHGK
jgi:hypothetical protein